MLEQNLVFPDLWQQAAVRALRAGQDVVVDAPTGAGKTYIFELLYGSLRGRTVFTVPTRALANDKLAEWRARGWDVGISTGDISHRLDARVVVATLETQKGALLQRRGPNLLVIDEYQMIADPVRGVNYELAVALAPPTTQLLLLSGSVANPQDIVDWLRRIGRDAVLVSHRERPVPLQQVDLENLPSRTPSSVRSWWARAVGNALAADLGPVLLFAPRRQSAEDLAIQIASLPVLDPLVLTPEQTQLAGPRLAKLLRQRVAFHHSGLSYAQRAGLIEPLAKHGQLRAVVATMGLAAGINFSMRSVSIAGTSYVVGAFDRQVRPDELLQMYGRAGRRGLDEIGYALVAPFPPRLLDARPRKLRRANPLDWPTLIAVMRGALNQGVDPFEAALEANRRLFTPDPIPIGVERSRETGPMPCGIAIDMERARFLRRGALEMLNSRGEWQLKPAQPERATLGEAMIRDGERWRPALALARTLERIKAGTLCKLPSVHGRRYGRRVIIGARGAEGQLDIAPWIRTQLKVSRVSVDDLQKELLPRVAEIAGGGRIAALEASGDHLYVRIAYDELPVEAWRDAHGVALIDPPERKSLPEPCWNCVEQPWCRSVEITQSPASWWFRLGLIERDGTSTRRGAIFSFFQHGEGLAVAAALEDESYPIEDLIFDLASLRAGPRFSEGSLHFSGRLGALCQQTYLRADVEGYLSMGVPTEYGAAAGEVVRNLVEQGFARQKLLTESIRQGDLERALIEWRSLLRHVVMAPDYDWHRWRDLKSEAVRWVETTESPTSLEVPALTAAQQRRPGPALG